MEMEDDTPVKRSQTFGAGMDESVFTSSTNVSGDFKK
jgi:hypothetical protein